MSEPSAWAMEKANKMTDYGCSTVGPRTLALALDAAHAAGAAERDQLAGQLAVMSADFKHFVESCLCPNCGMTVKQRIEGEADEPDDPASKADACYDCGDTVKIYRALSQTPNPNTTGGTT